MDVAVPFIIVAIIVVVVLWSIFSKSKSEQIVYPTNRSSPDFNTRRATSTDSFESIGKFETKIMRTSYKDLPVYQFLMRGVIPIKNTARNITLATSIIDVTEMHSQMPVISMAKQFQESGTPYFISKTEVGRVEPGNGWFDWTPFGLAPVGLLVPPKKGLRRLAFYTRILNTSVNNDTDLSRFDSQYLGGMTTHYVEFDFKEHGYLEFDKNIEKIDLLIIKIVMYVAMIDGVLHHNEGSKIKEWAKKRLMVITPSKSEEMKEKFNSTIKLAHSEMKSGFNESVFRGYLSEFNELSVNVEKNELFDLLLEVLVSDGVAHERQLQLLNTASDLIDLDYRDIQRIKDDKFLDLDIISDNQSNLEEILGISEYMTTTEIRKKLNEMFKLWNSRTGTLTDPEEKDKANQMLDLIARAREKYTANVR